MLTATYDLPVYGLGTDFSDFERPVTFAEAYENRFRNITGGAERRPGMAYQGTQITGNPNLTRLHEYVGPTGTTTLMVSDDFGTMWRYDSGGSAAIATSGKSAVRMISAMADNLLIVVNGVDRNFYTDDGVTFQELKAIITKGTLAAGSDPDTVIDGDISNWLGTLVANNDIVHDVTTGAYGIVTAIVSGSLTTTPMGGASATGAGLPLNLPNVSAAAGDAYELIDYVDLNIIPQGNGNLDNVATATTGTAINVVAVSGVNFANTTIRTGDVIFNSTRNAIDFVASISANVNIGIGITGQTSGDALVFLKSAMPIASWMHVHYGRVAYLDSRDQNTIVWSAPDDPQDLTTYQKTLAATSFSFGTQQPTGDILLSMTSFQKYFVASGQKNLYIYEGITPIADASTTDIDFLPVAFYPNGIASRFGLGTNGSDLLHITTEGLQAINIGNISNTTVQNNASVPVRDDMLNAILAATSNNIQLSPYPRRSWLINKVGDSCWILNTNPTYNEAGQLQIISSWSIFTGPWAQLNHYFVRRNGDLLGCGLNGRVYQLDSSAATDVGAPIATDLKTAWLTMEEPRKTVRVKQGQYIKPVFESTGGIGYTILAVAGWDAFSSDSIVVSAVGAGQIGSAIVGTTPIGAGNFSQADKFPLRWRGEQVRIEFTTNSSASPDIITGFTLYGSIAGVR